MSLRQQLKDSIRLEESGLTSKYAALGCPDWRSQWKEHQAWHDGFRAALQWVERQNDDR